MDARQNKYIINMHKLRLTIVLWLTIAVTGVWADTVDSVMVEDQTVELIPDQVKMSDGTVVTARRLPRRAPDEDYTYTYKGVKYTYITGNNYTRFFDTSVHQPWDNTYQYRFDDDGWLRYHGYSGAPYIVAATIDEESVPDNGEVFILNDLVGYFKSHTHLACVADQGFSGKSKVKRVYFQDSDAWSYNSNTDFMFFIGHRAFNNAPQLEKIDLMQYITKGTNHWEPMPTNCIPRIWSNMLEGSPNAMIRVATSTLNSYRSSSMWSDLRDRIISYEPSGYEINDYGVRYKCMLAEDNKTYLTNDGKQRETVMKQLRLWNADYQSFNAGSLLADPDNGATVYYTTVEGNDAAYLKKNNGVARVYNDIGSYYNYKTIAIRRNAFLNCSDLKAVEFYQTNGRSENSYSEPAIVIENGAFKGCKNLKELRMYYYVQDGDDRWVNLGPKDVIPGNNIFGLPSTDELKNMTDAQLEAMKPFANEDFRILVSPTRYMEFLNDPNWVIYRQFIEAADYEPTNKAPIVKEGLTYEYMSTSSGMLSTDNVVSQNLSWWSVPVLVAEIALYAYSAYSLVDAMKGSLVGVNVERQVVREVEKKLGDQIGESVTATLSKGVLQDISDAAFNIMIGGSSGYSKFAGLSLAKMGATSEEIASLVSLGACNEAGILVGSDVLMNLGFGKASMVASQILAIANKAILAQGSSSALSAVGQVVSKEIVTEYVREALPWLTKILYAGGYIGGSLGANMSAGLLAARMLGGDYNGDLFHRGLVANNMQYLHNVAVTGTGLNLIYTPSKNLVYHQYISKADPNLSSAVIYAGANDDTRTMTFRKNVFAGNKNLQQVMFREAEGATTKESVPMLITIPDSAFAGCTNLTRVDLRLYTGRNPSQALGPENFILCGDSIFAGCDSTKLKIIIPKDRKQDFLTDGMWSKYKRFFTYEETTYPGGFNDYGVNYAYAYEGNTTKKVSMVSGHKVEHLVAWQADNDWLNSHKGQLGLFNDIGIYNNYKLDYVKKEAFRGNQNLKGVSCWDLKGWAWCGDIYYDFNVALQDSAFADCKNLESFDLLYLCTDGINEAKELQPSQIQLGSGVFDNTPKLKLKMTRQQQRWFEADEAWAAYKDKFTPCLVRPVDEGVKKALSGLRYTTAVGSPSEWDDIIDMSRIKEIDFSFYENFNRNEKIRQFPEFKQFEWAGLDFVGNAWFVACNNLTAIELPSTIKSIGSYSFQNCDLREIEIPAAVTSIGERAFHNNYNLKSVRCLGTTPAEIGTKVFEVNSWPSEVVTDGFKIYVPAEAVAAYKKKWSEYKDYIVAASDAQTFPKRVTTTKVGELASKLGLETIMDGNYLEGLKGAYWNIDSLTVSGPLNGVDVGVLRFLAGADVNNSDPTYGQLRYLNLYNARLKQDKVHPYQCHGINDFIDKDDVVDEYMFYYCKSLETVILPKEATYIGEHVFDHAVNLKRLAIGDKTTGYDDRVTYKVPGIDEMVFLTTEKAVSDAFGGVSGTGQLWFWTYDSWETPINAVYCRENLKSAYANEPTLTKWMHNLAAPFRDDRALEAFVAKGHFFPSEYLQLTNIDGILEGTDVETFDELRYFTAIGNLGKALAGCDRLKRVTLPDTLRYMGYEAFRGCRNLSNIFINCDSVPTLGNGVFADLPYEYRIIVPKTLLKRYREAWPLYAHHIFADNSAAAGSDVLVVTTTEKNTLAKELRLRVKKSWKDMVTGGMSIAELEGNYTDIRKLKVVGPISGADFSVLRYLAGYCPWTDARNYLGRLEYIDLYDAQVEPSDWYAAYDKNAFTNHSSVVKEANVLPYYAFLKAYALKTLILPKTVTTIPSRALLECENLETLVIGDSTTYINWDALDDCASLTSLYLLPKQKAEMTQDNWVWRNMCNNYSPTFDAFYVRPSLYDAYLRDEAYTGSWQRTNNISRGAFEDDESFAAFASHAAAKEDDLLGVDDVSGWFRGREGIKDLSPLRYTLVTELKAADMKPLTQLERIAFPVMLENIEDNSFANATNLHWADFTGCESTTVINELRKGGLRKKGLTENTLCYMPKPYGQTDEVNVIVDNATTTYRLVDGQDYDVPYGFSATQVENTRSLNRTDVLYSVCLPYSLNIPEGAIVYRLKDSNPNELVFTETTETMEAGKPYLVRSTGDIRLNSNSQTEIKASNQVWSQQDDAVGFTLRGTFQNIGNAEASELGAYVLQTDGKWHAVLSDTEEHRKAKIPAYRCFLLQSRGIGARTISMTLDDNTTGIDTIRTIDNDGTETVYDLNGRKVGSNAKGVVIRNNRKVFNK